MRRPPILSHVVAGLLLAAASAFAAPAAMAASLLMISVDGLRPADVLDAERRGITVSARGHMMKVGAYAKSVVGVLPTLTYPSHATLITGVAPAPATSPSRYKGMHGYFAAEPAMRSSLFVDVPAVARPGGLGTVDMRGNAPLVARMLGIPLPSAEAASF